MVVIPFKHIRNCETDRIGKDDRVTIGESLGARKLRKVEWLVGNVI